MLLLEVYASYQIILTKFIKYRNSFKRYFKKLFQVILEFFKEK